VDKDTGIFLEFLFGFIGVVLIIDNQIGGAILMFLLVGLVDLCWSW
jgi:hypothetical protein